MRWTKIVTMISKPYEILEERYSTRSKYFLIQNKTDYFISDSQFNRILQTNTLNPNYTVSTLNGIEERLYKSKLQ